MGRRFVHAIRRIQDTAPRGPVTLDRPDPNGRAVRGASSGFPSDLFEQARGRLRLVAGFLFCGFMFDVLVFVAMVARIRAVPPDEVRSITIQAIFALAATISAFVWWAARSPRLSASRIHTMGLVYEVVICFVAAASMYRQCYLDTGLIVPLTWVPAIVIMFPLIVPGPPRRMLSAAVASAAMGPLALLFLDLTGRVDTGDGSGYVPAVVAAIFAAALAFLGARVIYGLGREVARARAMGSYQLEEKLGEGGMGEVWRARHLFLARPAAIKLIRPALVGNAGAGVTEEARRRFEREAQVIAGLRSPHTVDLFDFGITADGVFYYAMELLDGLDADALIRRFGPMPAERAVHVLTQVCHSLSEAESLGLVHRDIKPSNIFVCRYGEDHDFVKVLDFGIVKATRDPGEAGTTHTAATVIRGTPAFMAPEQALGGDALDARADIYALGCVAYWLLTGQLVFHAETPAGLLAEHVRTIPSPPSARTELAIPGELDHVLLSCLAKDPGGRPQTARELSRRLAGVEFDSAWTAERAGAWWEHHRPAVQAAI